MESRYPIREMAVFGSYARGEQTEDSDVDVLVDLGDGITLLDIAGLQIELGDVLGLPVDLAMKDCLKPHIAPSILHDMVEHARLAQIFVQGMSADEFEHDFKTRHAVINVLTVIGGP